jgi:hypothetical protein
MKRLIALALLLPYPVANAQDDAAEGRRLAAAFSQADLNQLGECQARVEGMGLLVTEFEGWLQREGHTEPLAAIRKARDQGEQLIASFADVRRTAATAKGFDLAASDAAHARMLTAFQRQAGEDNYAAYSRWRQQTALSPSCSAALKRGRWKIEIDELSEKE